MFYTIPGTLYFWFIIGHASMFLACVLKLYDAMRALYTLDSDSLVQHCNISIDNALEILQSYTKPLVCLHSVPGV